MTDRVTTDIAEERADEIMQLQQEIALQANQSMVGKVVTVICDQAEGRNGIGRTFADAPDIDNMVHFSAKIRLQAGKSYQVKITEAETFDLFGNVC